MASTLDVGLGFTIDTKVMVDGSPQYKVHNSKDAMYYVTANEAHVYAKQELQKSILKDALLYNIFFTVCSFILESIKDNYSIVSM
ncbi:N-acetylmuramoyl-L-alanine amidase [Bacillus sp. DX4.1]|uniref:N-acetylmuramoyl-L-alanine amidase n=1 Tax=Bacillus sp. DX4.1 TaxID=3055867 RepID=UPI0025A1C1A8|nr:N-acetylmuramoyl-L-alanine amidase [Bacillus sp. DX4.1]MDM5186429.1 N-acetylmuramoyl-L-alanine amidase [Bacillus sp. DX4.1]